MSVLSKWRQDLSNMSASQRIFVTGYLFAVVWVCVGTAVVSAVWHLTSDIRLGLGGIAIIFAGFVVAGLAILRKWKDLEIKHRVAAILLVGCGVALLVLQSKLAASVGVTLGNAG